MKQATLTVQFMVKDSKKYAATGGWGFGHFADRKPGDGAFMKSCFPCHEKTKRATLSLLVLRLDAETRAERNEARGTRPC